MNFVTKFEEILNNKTLNGSETSDLAMHYLYDNRNNMTFEQFADCMVSYGHYVYNEG